MYYCRTNTNKNSFKKNPVLNNKLEKIQIHKIYVHELQEYVIKQGSFQSDWSLHWDKEVMVMEVEVREHFGSIQAAGFYFYFLSVLWDIFHKKME